MRRPDLRGLVPCFTLHVVVVLSRESGEARDWEYPAGCEERVNPEKAEISEVEQDFLETAITAWSLSKAEKKGYWPRYILVTLARALTVSLGYGLSIIERWLS